MTTAPDIELLYTNYHTAIFEFLRRRVLAPGSSPELAEDMMQETFRKAFEAVQRGVEVTHPSGWLFQIARNMVVDFYRYKKHHLSAVAWDEAWCEHAHEPSPYDYAVSAIGCEAIEACMERLTEPQARVIVLMAEGCISEELGAATGCSVQAGKAMLHRGRKNLRQLLERGYA